jgi:hypothetical protein
MGSVLFSTTTPRLVFKPFSETDEKDKHFSQIYSINKTFLFSFILFRQTHNIATTIKPIAADSTQWFGGKQSLDNGRTCWQPQL